MPTLVSPESQKKYEKFDRERTDTPFMYRGSGSSFSELAYKESLNAGSNEYSRGVSNTLNRIYSELGQQMEVDLAKHGVDDPSVPNPTDPEPRIARARAPLSKEKARNIMQKKEKLGKKMIKKRGIRGNSSIFGIKTLRERWTEINQFFAGGILGLGVPYFEPGTEMQGEKDKFLKKAQKAYELTGKEKYNLTEEKIEQMRKERQRVAKAEAKIASERSTNLPTGAGFGAQFAAELPHMASNATDILGFVVDAAFLGGSGSMLRNAGKAMILEGVIEGSRQWDISKIQEEAGIEYNSGDFTRRVSTGALFGGILEGVGDAGARVIKKYAMEDVYGELAKKINDSDATNQEIREVLEQIPEEKFRQIKYYSDIDEIKYAQQIYEMDKWLRQNNVLDVDDYGKQVRHYADALERAKQVEMSIMEGKEKPDFSEGKTAEKDMGLELMASEVDDAEVEGAINNRNPDLDINSKESEENSSVAKFWKDPETGELHLIEGEQAAKDSLESDGATEGIVIETENMKDATTTVAGMQIQSGRGNIGSIARMMGEPVEKVKRQFKINEHKSLSKVADDLEDSGYDALREEIHNGKNYNMNALDQVAKVASKENHEKAVRLVADVDDPAEARARIKDAEQRGYDKVMNEPKDAGGLKITKERSKMIDATVRELGSRDKITLPNGKEVKIDDEFIEGIQEIARGDNEIARAINRQARESARKGGGGYGDRAKQVFKRIRQQIDDGPFTGDNVRKAASSKKVQETASRSRSADEFRERAERIRSKKGYREMAEEQQGEIENLQEELDDALDGDKEIKMPSPKIGEKTTTLNKRMEELKARKNAIDEAMDCAGL